MDPDLIQVAQITWSRRRLITDAEGACELVLGARADALLGESLHRALRISEARAKELDQIALEAAPLRVEFVPIGEGQEPCVLRLALGRSGENASAAIANLRQFLAGAPPIQVSALASSVSHELRNPLSSVKMAVQTLARNSSLSERDRRRLAIANREIRTMERMLWLFSEYGRGVPPTVESVPLRSLVQEAAALVAPELAERRIEVHVEGDPSARAHVEADPVARVLSQLLLDVATGHQEGSTIDVQIRATAAEGFQLQVMDPAGPRDPKDPASTFEPFSSLLSRGAGLSLAALSRVMESHGGKLSADWSSGRGTLYTLSFPG